MPVFPKWLLTNLEAEDERFIGKHWSYPNEPTIIFSEREQDFLSLVLGNVCKACNSGWLAQLEEDTRPLLEALLTGRPTLLTREQCNILARWTFKTAAALNYSVNYKKIVPLEHIRQFSNTGQIPENATVDFAWCYSVGIHWFLGGNKQFAVLSKKITESEKKASYVITLQFDHVLLRLSWVAVEGIKAIILPANVVYRIFPQDNSELQLVRGRFFKEVAQFHFMATILAMEGAYPHYVVWDGHTQKDYHWDGIHDCMVTHDMRLISVQKTQQSFSRSGMEVVIIFTCQRGQPAVEVMNISDHGGNGLGTYCLSKVIAENPAITFRNLITRMNDLIAEMGFDQVSEVICKADLLDHTFCNDPPYPKPLAMMIFDMCRTPSEPGRYIIDHDEFSP